MPTEAPHGRFSTQHATPLGKYEEIRRAARIQAETAPGLTHPFLFPPFSPAGVAGRALPVTSRGQGAPAQLRAAPSSGPRRAPSPEPRWTPGPAELQAPASSEPGRAPSPAELRALLSSGPCQIPTPPGAAAPPAAPHTAGGARSRSCPVWLKRAPPAQGPLCPSGGRGGIDALLLVSVELSWAPTDSGNPCHERLKSLSRVGKQRGEVTFPSVVQ